MIERNERSRDGLGCSVMLLAVGCWIVSMLASARVRRAEARLDKLEARAAWFVPEGQTHEAEVPRESDR